MRSMEETDRKQHLRTQISFLKKEEGLTGLKIRRRDQTWKPSERQAKGFNLYSQP